MKEKYLHVIFHESASDYEIKEILDELKCFAYVESVEEITNHKLKNRD